MSAFKTRGPVLVGVLAIMAIAAPAAQASAQPKFTADNNTKGWAVNQVSPATNRLIAFGEEITCETGYFTQQSDIAAGGSTTILLWPVYKECHTKSGKFVTGGPSLNCMYRIWLDTNGKLMEHVYSNTFDVFCEKGEGGVTFTLYSDKSEGTKLCTYFIPKQEGIGPLTTTVDTGSQSSTDSLTFQGTLQKISISKSGACGAESGQAEYAMKVTMEGRDEFGNHRGIRVCNVTE